MKILLKENRKGTVFVEEVPEPSLQPGGIIVRNHYSAISLGTEMQNIDIARKSLLQKARSRPDDLKKVFNLAKKEGYYSAYTKAIARLETPAPLGYSSSGEVVSIGGGIDNFSLGDYVACGGIGFANHSEFSYIPKNL